MKLPQITFRRSTIETLEKDLKYDKVNNKDKRARSLSNVDFEYVYVC